MYASNRKTIVTRRFTKPYLQQIYYKHNTPLNSPLSKLDNFLSLFFKIIK